MINNLATEKMDKRNERDLNKGLTGNSNSSLGVSDQQRLRWPPAQTPPEPMKRSHRGPVTGDGRDTDRKKVVVKHCKIKI
jgi:hypothetical protein